MAKQKEQDALRGAATGAGVGFMVGGPAGAGVGAGLGALGGYFGVIPGSGQDDGKKAEKKRLAQIAKAQEQLGYMQQVGTQQRGAITKNLGQMYNPLNDRLAHLYGQGARVNMPAANTPLDQMYLSTAAIPTARRGR